MSARRARRTLAGLVLVVSGMGCELGEIAVPVGDPVLLVQGLMRPDRAQQWIIVERSLIGNTADVGAADFIPGERVQVPVRGATVTVSNLSFPNDPCGATVTFREDLGPPGDQSNGLYWAAAGCPTMRGGDTLALLVQTGTEVVTGTTVMPGATRMVMRSTTDSVTVPGQILSFNRDVDTLEFEVEPRGGRMLHLSIHPRPPGDGLDQFVSNNTTWLWADSTAMKVPGNFVNVFEAEFEDGDDVPDLFVAGQVYEFTVAWADQNFFDNLRSANSPLSGRGFINALDGGFGTFGSLVAARTSARVIGTLDDPREGTYQLSGTVSSVTVDLDLEVYLGRAPVNSTTTVRFSALATGRWVAGAFDHSVSGLLEGPRLSARIMQARRGVGPDGRVEVAEWFVSGVLPATGAGTLRVIDSRGEFVGTLELTKTD